MLILLFLLWVILNGKITFEIVWIGIVLSLAIYWFTCKYLEYSPKTDLNIMKNLFYIILYIIVLVIEIIKSSFLVIKIVFKSDIQIEPQVVFFEVPIKNEILLTVLANSITLTPGTITVDFENSTLCACFR